LRDLRVVTVDLAEVGIGVGVTGLAQVFAQRSDDRDMLPPESADDEAVEDAGFLLALPAGHEGLGDALVDAVGEVLGEAESEIVAVAVTAVGEVEFGRALGDDGGAGGREEGRDLGQPYPLVAVEPEAYGGIG